MTTILITDTIAAAGLARLRERFHVVERHDLSSQAFAEAARDVDAIITRSGTAITPEILFAGSRLMVVGRAGIGIDNIDVAAACRAGAVAGAAVDVFTEEPLPADHPLRDAPNVILTPHIAGSTREAQDAIAREIAEDITAALTGGIPRNLVNPAVLTRQEVVA